MAKRKSILAIVAEAYPDGEILHYYDPVEHKLLDGDGDGLARFIATEIFESDADDLTEENLLEAIRLLEMAARDIQLCINALKLERRR